MKLGALLTDMVSLIRQIKRGKKVAKSTEAGRLPLVVMMRGCWTSCLRRLSDHSVSFGSWGLGRPIRQGMRGRNIAAHGHVFVPPDSFMLCALRIGQFSATALEEACRYRKGTDADHECGNKVTSPGICGHSVSSLWWCRWKHLPTQPTLQMFL